MCIIDELESFLPDRLHVTWQTLGIMDSFCGYLYDMMPHWHGMKYVELDVFCQIHTQPHVVAILDLFNAHCVNNVISYEITLCDELPAWQTTTGTFNNIRRLLDDVKD